MLGILEELGNEDTQSLSITEASLLDLSDAELQEQVKGCNAVVSCLGHTLDFKGLWGHPRKLVTQATKRLTAAISSNDTSGFSASSFCFLSIVQSVIELCSSVDTSSFT